MGSTYDIRPDWPGRRAGDPAHDAVAAFLVLDIQRSSEWARDVATRIEAVKTGALASWERVGNAYRLSLSPGGATIEDMVVENTPVQRVSLEDLEAAVSAWIEAIREGDRPPAG